MSSDLGDHPNGQTFLVETMYKTEFSTEKFVGKNTVDPCEVREKRKQI